MMYDVISLQASARLQRRPVAAIKTLHRERRARSCQPVARCLRFAASIELIATLRAAVRQIVAIHFC